MSRKRTHANMWRTSEPITAPAKRGTRLHAYGPAEMPVRDGAHTPSIATAVAEQRFGNRADKLLRRFSWEDGE